MAVPLIVGNEAIGSISLTFREICELTADVAENGHEAIRRLERHAYALVLMDCQMPELDGFEATARIRASEAPGQRTPVIAMTASAMQGDREHCLAAGMDDYISKPVRIEDLRTVFERWLPGELSPAIAS